MGKTIAIFALVLGLSLPAAVWAASDLNNLKILADGKVLSVNEDLAPAHAAVLAPVANAPQPFAARLAPATKGKAKAGSADCKGLACAIRQTFQHPIISNTGKELPSPDQIDEMAMAKEARDNNNNNKSVAAANQSDCRGPSCAVKDANKRARLSNRNTERHDKIDGDAAPSDLGGGQASSAKATDCHGPSCAINEAKQGRAFQNPAATPDKIDGAPSTFGHNFAAPTAQHGHGQAARPAAMIQEALKNDRLFNQRPNVRPERLGDNPRW